MILVTISPARISQKVWLKFSDGHLLPLKIDDLYILSLRKGQEVSPDLYRQIELLSANYILFEYSLRQIALSPKVLPILAQKQHQYWLRVRDKYHYQMSEEADIINKINQKLEADNLIDSQAYIEYFVRTHPKYSSQQLKHHFTHLGLQFQISESDLPKITKLLAKKYQKTDFSDYKQRSNVYSALFRRGFAIDDIKTAIDDYCKNR